MAATRPNTAYDELVLRWAPIAGTAQEAFFDDDTPDGNILFQGGWGAGKTMSLTAKMLKLSALNAPCPGLWTVPVFDHIHETILPTIESRDPDTNEPWFVGPGQWHYQETRHLFTWVGGGPIQFVSAENPKRIAGPNMAFAGTDEPGSIKHEAWRNTAARVRHPGAKLRQKIAAGTPEDISYLVDYFGPDRTDKYRLYEMPTAANVELLRHNPEFIVQLQAHMTEAEVLAYLGGKAVNTRGALAYPAFDAERYWRTDVPIDATLPLRIAFDFNVSPMACIVGQQAPGPYGIEARVIDAVTIYGSTVMQVCDELQQRYPRWAPGVVIYGDATGKNRSTVSTKSNYDIIRERLVAIGPLTMKVPTSNPAVTNRLNAVNVMCRNALGHERLVIRKTDPPRACLTRPLVQSLQRTVKKSGTDDVEKKPGETVTHHGEALGYWIVHEFPAQRPVLHASTAHVPWLV